MTENSIGFYREVGHEDSFEDDAHAYYLDCGDSFRAIYIFIYICQNLPTLNVYSSLNVNNTSKLKIIN